MSINNRKGELKCYQKLISDICARLQIEIYIQNFEIPL
jgi:hypothetical protein